MNRLKYFFYYLLKTDRKKFFGFLKYSSTKTARSKMAIVFDSIQSTLQYNISLLDYFYFRFYEKNKSERKTWAGTGYMYEYQLKMNPEGLRELLEDKIKFLQRFQKFIKRKFIDLQKMDIDLQKLNQLLSNPSRKLVLKNSRGQVGAEVEIVNCRDFTARTLLDYMHSKRYNLIEEFVVQHPALMELSPSGLNTIRLFTQLHNDKVKFLGARLRISVNSPVDNMAAGNLAAALNIETGEVLGPAVYSDITKNDEAIHPVTGKSITGFKVPFWKETVEMAKNAAIHSPENKSVGWDIAVTANGPELIEGNHNWCKLLWQLPVKQGLKYLLEPNLHD